MRLIRVESRMVEAVGYNADQGILQVVYASGKVYNYEGVPPEVYEDLMAADSVGNYILKHIMNSYPDYEVG